MERNVVGDPTDQLENRHLDHDKISILILTSLLTTDLSKLTEN